MTMPRYVAYMLTITLNEIECAAAHTLTCSRARARDTHCEKIHKIS